MGTPPFQVNGVAGESATLYAQIFNFTGTPLSDDGSGTPVAATKLSFAGVGWTLNPGQANIEALYSAAIGTPGWPEVDGSADGMTPGTSGYVALGTFDLMGIAPGVYEEDFVAGAYATDISSPVWFDDIPGTLRLTVTDRNAVPEPGFGTLLVLGVVFLAAMLRRSSVRRLC
jgi:hypothetical protein